jgi:hypothetical protein
MKENEKDKDKGRNVRNCVVLHGKKWAEEAAKA